MITEQINNKWGSLGGVVFEATQTPNRVQSQRRWRIVPHRLLNRYPSHEHIGEDGHTLTLEVDINRQFNDPAAAYDALVDMADSGQANDLIIGFKYWGDYAVQEINKQLTSTRPDGRVEQLRLSLKLIEIREDTRG